MNTPLTVLFFIIASILTQLAAQDMPSTFSIYGGGGFGYRTINLSLPNSTASSDGRDASEHPGFSWSSGLSVGRQVSSRVWFRTGARIVNTTYRTDTKRLVSLSNQFSGFDVRGLFGSNSNFVFLNLNSSFCGFGSTVCSVGSGSTSTEEIITEFHTNFRQVEIPFIIRYEFNEQRLRPYAEAGLAVNYLLFSRFYSVTNGRTSTVADRELDGPGRFGATTLLSFGASYGITSSLDVFAHPVFRYNLSKVSLAEGDLRERPLSLILEVGIRKTVFN